MQPQPGALDAAAPLRVRLIRQDSVTDRVNQIGGNRSGFGLNRYQTDPNSKFKKNKKILKILQGATNLMVSNFLKNSSI